MCKLCLLYHISLLFSIDTTSNAYTVRIALFWWRTDRKIEISSRGFFSTPHIYEVGFLQVVLTEAPSLWTSWVELDLIYISSSVDLMGGGIELWAG